MTDERQQQKRPPLERLLFGKIGGFLFLMAFVFGLYAIVTSLGYPMQMNSLIFFMIPALFLHIGLERGYREGCDKALNDVLYYRCCGEMNPIPASVPGPLLLLLYPVVFCLCFLFLYPHELLEFRIGISLSTAMTLPLFLTYFIMLALAAVRWLIRRAE